MEFKIILLLLTLLFSIVIAKKKLGRSGWKPYDPHKERIGGVCDISGKSPTLKCPPGTSCVMVKYCS